MQTDNYTLGIIWSIGSYTAGRFIFWHRNRYFLEQIQKYLCNSLSYFKYSAYNITGSMYISEKSEYQQNNKFIGKGITDKRLYCKRTDKFFIK